MKSFVALALIWLPLASLAAGAFSLESAEVIAPALRSGDSVVIICHLRQSGSLIDERRTGPKM